MERKRKLLPKKLRDLWMKGIYKHMEASLKCFDNHRCVVNLREKFSPGPGFEPRSPALKVFGLNNNMNFLL